VWFDKVLASLRAAGYSNEEILAALNYEEEFPYSETEDEKEFEAYLNETYNDICVKTKALMTSSLIRMKCVRLVAEKLGQSL